MYSTWTKHLKTDNDKENFRRTLLSSKTVLDRLKDILKEQYQALERSELSGETYNQPNWDYRQAHSNGQKAELYKLIKLIDLDQQKINTEN